MGKMKKDIAIATFATASYAAAMENRTKEVTVMLQQGVTLGRIRDPSSPRLTPGSPPNPLPLRSTQSRRSPWGSKARFPWGCNRGSP